ncbi:MAG: UbiA family prenyltransferase [Planctomycetes bacterium]|nr:UbiA family prenyltransferase [Planctomycetota bacterium]
MSHLLRLLRASLAPTAAADVVAGALLAAPAGANPPAGAVAAGALASCLLYGGGMALNDCADAERDAVLHPERPIPSGRVTRAFAGLLGLVLLEGGVLLASLAGRGPLLAALAAAAAVLVYDFLAKRWTVAGAISLGLCRALNLLLGASIPIASAHAPGLATASSASSLGAAPLAWAGVYPVAAGKYALILGVYAALVTLLSTTEESGADRALRFSSRGIVLLLALPFVAGAWRPFWPAGVAAGALHGAVALILLHALRRLLLRPDLRHRALLVRDLVLAIPLVDGGLLAGAGQPVAGFAVALLAPAALLLGWGLRIVS